MSTLTLRDSLSRLLTPQEVDDNFTGLNNELAQAEADFYGNVDPASIPGVAMGPGFKWAHQAAGQMKIRNAANNGWFDLYELFSKIYTRASVVGTVGQNAGLPTGALVEQTSNPNGLAFRYAGGMQICVAQFVRQIVHASGPLDSYFYNSNAWDYPAVFSSAPRYVHGSFRTGGRMTLSTTAAVTSNSCVVYSVVPAERGGLTYDCWFIAVGRWHD